MRLLHMCARSTGAVCCALLLLAQSGCDSSVPVTTESSPTAATDGALYQDPKGAFAMRMPATWTQKGDTPIWKVASADGSAASESIVVVVTGVEPSFTADKSAIAFLRKSIELSDYKDARIRRVLFQDGRRAYEMEYTHTVPGKTTRIVQLVVTGDLYTVTAMYMAPPPEFPARYEAARPYLLTLTAT